jgi:outer membrane autotransporter protein
MSRSAAALGGRDGRRLAAAVLLLAVGAGAMPARAQTTSWTDGTGSWFVPGNWSAGVPSAATNTTNVTNGGTAQIAGAAANAGSKLNIDGGSTVDVQAGGSLTETITVIQGNGTLLLSGSTAFTSITLSLQNGGNLRAQATGTPTIGNMLMGPGTATVSAAPGQTLTLAPGFLQLVGQPKFGSATDTGVVVLAAPPVTPIIPGTTLEVIGGTLKAGNAVFGTQVTKNVSSTTVDAGATLDLNGFLTNVSNLQGGGTVINGSLIDLQAGNFSGSITGTASVVIVGPVTFAGTNTNTGGTTINGGATLQLGNGGAGGSIVGNVTDNGTLIFNRSDSYTFAGAITGTGSLQQNGTGVTILTGASNYTGPTTVNAGTLDVNGSTTSTVTVNNGGTLKGNGTIGGLVVAGGGAVAPGNSIGTLNVSGNVSFGAGSIYQVEVNAAGQSDKIAATGTATLSGGTVQALPQQGPYANSTRYTILTANGGVTGTFANATSSMPILVASLSYDANDVFLTLTRNPTFFSSQALTPNQAAVGAALDQSPLSSALVQAVEFLTRAATRQAFDALSGEIHASAQSVMLDDSRYLRQAVLGRLRQASFAERFGPMAALGVGGPTLSYAQAEAASGAALAYDKAFPVKAPLLSPARVPELAWWAQGVGAWGRIDSDGNAADIHLNLAGFFTGVDRRLGDSAWAGLAGGYTNSSASVGARLSSANIDTAHLAAYAGASFAGFNLRSGVSFSWSTLGTNRSILFPGFFDTATARYDAGTAQAFGEVGYGLTVGPVAAEPFAGLAWVHLHANGFVETGGLGIAALTGASANDDLGYSTLGLRVATSYTLPNGVVLTPRASAAWQHAFGGLTPTEALVFQSTGAGFTIAGVPIARDAALVEAGFDVRVTPQATLGLYYAGQIAHTAQDHSVKGNFTLRF